MESKRKKDRCIKGIGEKTAKRTKRWRKVLWFWTRSAPWEETLNAQMVMKNFIWVNEPFTLPNFHTNANIPMEIDLVIFHFEVKKRSVPQNFCVALRQWWTDLLAGPGNQYFQFPIKFYFSLSLIELIKWFYFAHPQTVNHVWPKHTQGYIEFKLSDSTQLHINN